MQSNKVMSTILQLRIAASRYVIQGPSGRMYVFEGPGSELLVDKRDVKYLLSKHKMEGCCGQPFVRKPIFKYVSVVYTGG